MIVISLSNCPPSLRGDLTKWLFEISTNVFVGKMTARVRDEIWGRIVNSIKNGRAVMIFGKNNEQGFDFRVHNGEWEPVDFDGFKIMSRPLPNIQNAKESRYGYSKASKYSKSIRFSHAKKSENKDIFAFVIIRTTGPDSNINRISSLGVVIFNKGEFVDEFQSILDNEDDGRGKSIIESFLELLENKTVVFEDSNKSLLFIEAECSRYRIDMRIGEKLSLKSLGKKYLYNLKIHNLKAL